MHISTMNPTSASRVPCVLVATNTLSSISQEEFQKAQKFREGAFKVRCSSWTWLPSFKYSDTSKPGDNTATHHCGYGCWEAVVGM
jgi:hypothetical protein